MSSDEMLRPELKLYECVEHIKDVFPKINEAAEKVESERRLSVGAHENIWLRIGACQRLIQQEFPEKNISTMIGEFPSESSQDINVVMGASNHAMQEHVLNTWLEVPLDNQVLIVCVDTDEDNKFEVKTHVCPQSQLEVGRESLGLVIETPDELERRGVFGGRGSQNRNAPYYERLQFDLDFAAAMNVDFFTYRRSFGELSAICGEIIEHPKVLEAMHLVNNGELSAPQKIEFARQQHAEQIKSAWSMELSMLPPEYVEANSLDGEESSWEKYINLQYQEYLADSNTSSIEKDPMSIEDFTKNFTYLLLEFQATKFINPLLPGEKRPRKFYESFYQHTKIYGSRSVEYFLPLSLTEDDYEVVSDDPEFRQFDGDSLITHALSGLAMTKSAEDGLCGAAGIGRVCTSQDRITNGNNEYVVVWRVQDILDAGYPLYRVREDFRDATVLREIRSYALPLALATRIDYTNNVPDIKNAVGAQIHSEDQYAGISYLENIRESFSNQD